MARPPASPQPSSSSAVSESPSSRWIIAHHDAWSRATLSPLFVALAEGNLAPDLFSQWLLDRVFMAQALVPACQNISAILRKRGIQFPLVSVAQEEADFLEQYAAREGLDLKSRWKLSYDGGRVVELIKSATEGSEGMPVQAAAHQASAAAVAAATLSAAPVQPAGGDATSRTAAVAAELPGPPSLGSHLNGISASPLSFPNENGLGSSGEGSTVSDLPLGNPPSLLGGPPAPTLSLCVAIAATWSFMLTSWQTHYCSRPSAGKTANGPHRTHSEVRRFLARDEALEHILEAQGVLDKLLNETKNPAEVSKAQKTFEELVLRRFAALESAMESGSKEGKAPLCTKCGRKGHTGERCTFKSHV